MIFIPETISFNLVRGDTFKLPIIINQGTQLDFNPYYLNENDALYIGITEPNQCFENAIIRKKMTSKDDKDGKGNLIFKLDSKDTQYLLPGKYYITIKLLSNNEVITILNEHLFNIIGTSNYNLIDNEHITKPETIKYDAIKLIDKSIEYIDLVDFDHIPDYAFYECTKLAKVNCPNVTTIGTGAFYYCSSLTNIELSDNTTEIKPAAFQGSGLESVKIPKELIKIDVNVFNYCSNLKNITFNDKIESIGNMAFRGCLTLEQDIILPESCKTVDQESFRHSSISYLSGYLTSIAGNAFRECTKLNTLVLKSNAFCTLSSYNALIGTPIASGEGFIYVPKILMENYKKDTNWIIYKNQIRSIEDYPEVINK